MPNPNAIQRAQFDLPEYWACALINADESGMEEDDIEAMNAWLEDHPQLGLCVDVSGEPEFAWNHDASEYVGACNCRTFTFELIEQD